MFKEKVISMQVACINYFMYNVSASITFTYCMLITGMWSGIIIVTYVSIHYNYFYI